MPHPKLGVPVPVYGETPKEKNVDEDKLLKFLAEDYRVNPGLYMTREDMKVGFEMDDAKLDALLVSLEAKGLVWLNRTKKGIEAGEGVVQGLARGISEGALPLVSGVDR